MNVNRDSFSEMLLPSFYLFLHLLLLEHLHDFSYSKTVFLLITVNLDCRDGETIMKF